MSRPNDPQSSVAATSVQQVQLTAKQDKLLTLLERRVQLHLQAESNPQLLSELSATNSSTRAPSGTKHAATKSLGFKEFLQSDKPNTNATTKSSSKSTNPSSGAVATESSLVASDWLEQASGEQGPSFDTNFLMFAGALTHVARAWHQVFVHAHEALDLVQEMESSHALVVTKTQALYDSFESILGQCEALSQRISLIEKPLPVFCAMEQVAFVLGFGVQLAMPTSALIAQGPQAAAGVLENQQPVTVFDQKRPIDVTAPTFVQALQRIDDAMEYLHAHPEYRDSASYLEAYETLAIAGLEKLKEYAVQAIDVARDGVQEAVAQRRHTITHGSTDANLLPSESSGNQTMTTVSFEETSAFYVHFVMLSSVLTVVSHQLARVRREDQFVLFDGVDMVPTVQSQVTIDSLAILQQTCEYYFKQRVALLSPVLMSHFDAMAQQCDIVNLLRLGCKDLVGVSESESRLFEKLFQKQPYDPLFAFPQDQSETSGADEQHTGFENMMFQLSSTLYNIVRPQILLHKELELLCEVIQVLQHEILESLVTPRGDQAGFVEPVVNRMIQDAQERLILCVQIFIRDEIEGFTPDANDLNYPERLVDPKASGNLYATWYPTLEHTLMCLSKIYHFVNMEIFEELAQDAIRICTASLKMASADLTAANGPLHGSLFLVKHLLTLREQITPFEIKFSLTAKNLDFTSTSDALANLLSDVTTIFTFSLENGLLGLITSAIPQVQQTTSDVKKELEIELKRSCAAFIDCVMQMLADPMIKLLKKVADSSAKTKISTQKLPSDVTIARIEQILDKVTAQLDSALPSVLESIRVYLRNASTEAILFKPVQKNLLEAMDKMTILLTQHFGPEERQNSEQLIERITQQLVALN